MDPAIALFDPGLTVADRINKLRNLVKTVLITYGYVVDAAGKLLGIVTMCDLLLAEKSPRLDELMLKDVFSFKPEMPLADTMQLALTRHFPVYADCDDQEPLVGLVRGQAMFQAEAPEISAQPGAMVPVTLKRLGADPATTSSIFLTTATAISSARLFLWQPY